MWDNQPPLDSPDSYKFSNKSQINLEDAIAKTTKFRGKWQYRDQVAPCLILDRAEVILAHAAYRCIGYRLFRPKFASSPPTSLPCSPQPVRPSIEIFSPHGTYKLAPLWVYKKKKNKFHAGIAELLI